MGDVFSVVNVDVVYAFVEREIVKKNQSPWIYQGYELCAEAGEILFKKNNYALARVTKNAGLITLQKLYSDSVRVEKDVTDAFLEILSLAQKS